MYCSAVMPDTAQPCNGVGTLPCGLPTAPLNAASPMIIGTFHGHLAMRPASQPKLALGPFLRPIFVHP